MTIFIIPAIFLLLAGWALHGVYFAPSQRQQARVLRKFFVPAHKENEVSLDWYGMSGMAIEEPVFIAPKHYLVVKIAGEEDYLEIDGGAWEKIALGAEVDIEYSLLFGFLPHVRKFQIADKTFA